ncbi:hypothetical protein Hanom_Chr12g01092041 [Helianthus anomalus]
MDGVNAPDENGKISNLLDPDVQKQTFEQKLQNWPNLKDEIGILLFKIKRNCYSLMCYTCMSRN